MEDIIIASSNTGKLAEFKALLAPRTCLSLLDLNLDSPEETACSFVENALLKARYVSQQTGKPALADDSGLVVDALNGAPGIYSARFADMHGLQNNIDCLLQKMQPLKNREAYFYCCIVFIRHASDPTPFIATGRLNGVIAENPAGEGGFGYDPVFYLPEYGCTVAQLPVNVKNEISHRALAMLELKRQLAELR